jgi:hypothetical protein
MLCYWVSISPHFEPSRDSEHKDAKILRNTKIFFANNAVWHPRRLGYPATLLWEPQISNSHPLQKYRETTNECNNTPCSAAGWQPTQHTFSGQDTLQFNTLKGVEANIKRKTHLVPVNKTSERTGHCLWQPKTQNRARNNALCRVPVSLCDWVR